MRKYRSIYVAASRQHVGKTTSTLGLASAFQKRGVDIGYCKPVGQQFLDLGNLRADKDAILFADLLNFDIDPGIHSPVILGKGATEEIIDHPQNGHLMDDIRMATSKLEAQKELIIYEGTGHPGVGSIGGVSNAQVAKEVGAGLIMILEGGIGSTIDMFNLCHALFREQKVPIIGVIVNKVKEEKLEKVKYYLEKYLKQMDIPLLGLLPYDPSLAYPVMRTIANAIHGTVIHNADMLNNKVSDIVAGSLLDVDELKKSSDLLLVVSATKVDAAIDKLINLSELIGLESSPLAGIVTTGQGEPGETTLEYIEKHKVPLIRTQLDTFGSVIKISRIEVKINRSTPWKVNRAIELIEENVDLDRILELSENPTAVG